MTLELAAPEKSRPVPGGHSHFLFPARHLLQEEEEEEGVGEEVEPGNEPAAAAAAGGCGLRGAGSPAGLCRISSEAWPLEVVATEEREIA